MTDWKRGSWTGSLNAWVRQEIRQHFRENTSARRSRYTRFTRLSHRIFDGGTFSRFIALYVCIAILVGVSELMLTMYMPYSILWWKDPQDVKSLLTNVTSYLITADVGVLGVISIAVGLVTIIAQRENASTDVQVYYHESLAFGVVASSIALLAVLCVQLLWPFQFALHWFGFGSSVQFFKVTLTAFHLTWLLLNLSGMAHFVATTLAFVQQTARERLRELYTTNVVLPVEMRVRLRQQLYLGAGPEFVSEFWTAKGAGWEEPTIYLGTDFSGAGETEVPHRSDQPLFLYDVRMAWVHWVVGRWLKRCQTSAAAKNKMRENGLRPEILLLFPPRLDDMAEVHSGLCRRRGGLPLSRLEKLVLQWAFKFRGKRDET